MLGLRLLVVNVMLVIVFTDRSMVSLVDSGFYLVVILYVYLGFPKLVILVFGIIVFANDSIAFAMGGET